MRKQFHGQLKAVPGMEPWLVKTYLDIQLSISDERDGGLFEETFLKELYAPLIKEIHLCSYKTTVELATDASFLLHTSRIFFPGNPATEFLWDAKYFLLFYIAIWASWGLSKYRWHPDNRKEDDGTIVPIPTNVKWNRDVRLGNHIIVTMAGYGFEHKDITLAHFVILAAVYGAGFIGSIGSNFWEKMRGQPIAQNPVHLIPGSGVSGRGRGGRRGSGATAGGRSLRNLFRDRVTTRSENL